MKIWEILKEENVGKEVIGSNKIKYRIALGGKDDVLLFPKKSISCELFSQIEMMTLDFEFIQQPVTFEEVLNSDKKCRIEHEELNKVIEKTNELNDSSTNEFLISFKKGEYLNFNNLLELFIWILSDSKIRKIIKEGKWYLEP
ncbi:hypothetical protein CB452P1_000060 [Clostridium phage CB452P1]|nr:hypothetical protein CB452P1_000060 [Clostridium phage CB452P1]